MSITVPDSFILLSLPLPPMLMEVIGAAAVTDKQFIGIYSNNKPFWSDGGNGKTFSYRYAWEPFYAQLKVIIPAAFGRVVADEMESVPPHQLLCDRQEEKLYIAPFQAVERLLALQYPEPTQPLTDEERAAQQEAIEEMIARYEQMSLKQMQEFGMFELFLPPDPQQIEKCNQLVEWLNAHMEEAIITHFSRTLNISTEQAKEILKMIEDTHHLTFKQEN